MHKQINWWLTVCMMGLVAGVPQGDKGSDDRVGLERPNTSPTPEVNPCSLDELIAGTFGTGGNSDCTNNNTPPPEHGGVYQPPPPPETSGGGYEPPPNNNGNSANPKDCECVPFYLCDDNNTINTDGVGLIDIRLKDECGSYDVKCCGLEHIRETNNPVITPRPPVATENKCGNRNFDGVGVRITGDKDNEAQYGEFPWMVAVVQPTTPSQDGKPVNVYQCGGSLIHPQVVLTGAHCVRGKNDLIVRAGEWDTQTKNELYPTQDRKVQEVIIHEQFNNNTLANDPALLILESPVDTTYENVGLICLPEENENMDGRDCVASGWGKDQFGKAGKYQVILKRVELPIVPRGPCLEALRNTRLGTHFKLHPSFICAGGRPGKDTCKGDGGSPLACPSKANPRVYVQAGIVAWGISCNTDTPGVYVNVPSFVTWIYNKLQQRGISLVGSCGNFNCNKTNNNINSGYNLLPEKNNDGKDTPSNTNNGSGYNSHSENSNNGDGYSPPPHNTYNPPPENNNGGGYSTPPKKSNNNGSYNALPENNNGGGYSTPPINSNNGGSYNPPTENNNDSGYSPPPKNSNNGGSYNPPPENNNGGGYSLPPKYSNNGGSYNPPPENNNGGGYSPPPKNSNGGSYNSPPGNNNGGGYSPPPINSNNGGSYNPPPDNNNGGGYGPPPKYSNNGGSFNPPPENNNGGGYSPPPKNSNNGGSYNPHPENNNGGGYGTPPKNSNNGGSYNPPPENNNGGGYSPPPKNSNNGGSYNTSPENSNNCGSYNPSPENNNGGGYSTPPKNCTISGIYNPAPENNNNENSKSCECVPFYLCDDNSTLVEDGVGLLDIRIKDECSAYDQKCCDAASVRPPDKPVIPTKPPSMVPPKKKCGMRNFDGVGVRIIGDKDSEAQYGEFPWMVAVLQPDTTRSQDGKPVNVYQCGGSLIHPQVVLTGAHCVKGKSDLVVRAGEWDTQTKNELHPTQDRKVQEVIIHEQFNNNSLANDPALLILESPVDTAYENVGLICLPEENENMDGRDCVASGWGKNQFGKEGEYQVILKRVELPIVPRGPCLEALRKTKLGTHFKLHPSFICAGGRPGKDTCKGDGGSPLACPSKADPEVYVQAGIVAWGVFCGTVTPGVYVNVPSFVTWIYTKLQDHGISLV